MPLTQVSSRAIEDTLRYVLGASGTNHYTFTGKGLDGTVNDPTLTLSRGHTYVFENRNSANAHPFYIKTSIANGGTNDTYNTGVTNNGGAGGTEIVFTVPHDAPDTLYYQCSSHSSMAGQLNIAGSVADGSITESKLADDAVTADKLANSINTAIAANTAKDLTALSASNLTSGTVPDARFPATLPAASAANLTSIPAANLTGALPAISGASLTGISTGKILQVVHGFTTTFFNTSSSTMADIGLSASITPSSSSNKILVFGNIGGIETTANNNYGGGELLRDSTVIIADIDRGIGFTADSTRQGTNSSFFILDTPSSTSSLTYKVRFRRAGGDGSISTQTNGSRSAITLMEVAV